MPTYDYRCDACSHAFELFQSMHDPVKRACPACRKRALKRLIGTGAAILVGGRGGSEPAEASSASDAPSTDEATSSDTDATKTPKAPDTAEKEISGSTSTPTHAAREHRGVGNLVDAARRTRREAESSGSKTTKSEQKTPGTSKKTAKKAAGKTPRTTAKKTAKKAAKKASGSRSTRGKD